MAPWTPCISFLAFDGKNYATGCPFLTKIMRQGITIEDCAKDGGEEFFTKMHCVRITNL